MKFKNEKEIKKCIAMIQIGKKIGFDPAAHIKKVAESIKAKPAP